MAFFVEQIGVAADNTAGPDDGQDSVAIKTLTALKHIQKSTRAGQFDVWAHSTDYLTRNEQCVSLFKAILKVPIRITR